MALLVLGGEVGGEGAVGSDADDAGDVDHVADADGLGKGFWLGRYRERIALPVLLPKLSWLRGRSAGRV